MSRYTRCRERMKYLLRRYHFTQVRYVNARPKRRTARATAYLFHRFTNMPMPRAPRRCAQRSEHIQPARCRWLATRRHVHPIVATPSFSSSSFFLSEEPLSFRATARCWFSGDERYRMIARYNATTAIICRFSELTPPAVMPAP